MAGYTTYYGICVQEVDPHYEPGCNFQPEKARIRRGAWLKHSSYASVIVDPTNPEVWQAAINAGDCIILPELKGTFDGGSPKMEPGFGDLKETYAGSDFKATISDRVYKENWPHYRSLVGQTDWHFVYLTESFIHITDVPVTVAPKNPISENVEDSVLWVSDISWFEFFTPAPHSAPAGFMSLTKSPAAIMPVCPVVTVTHTATSATITWAADVNATLGYRVFMFSDAGSTLMQSWTISETDTTSISKFGLTASTQYWYRVSPIDPSGAVDGFGNPVLVGNCALQTFTTNITPQSAYAYYDTVGLVGHEAEGTLLNITASEPGAAPRNLAAYTFVAGDLGDKNAIAAHVVAAINANTGTTGYTAGIGSDPPQSDMWVRAPISLASSMNGESLTFSYSGGAASTEFMDGVG